MGLPAIEVSDLSKRYVIEHESRHDNLRDTLHHTARKLWRRFRWGTGFQREEFWALKDLSFTVQPGEVVGIIGRNGAGKSTLLKILSRITEPTAGKVTLRGRVASLLEVGTGFHPDLTGRENIYLNGAILGMRRAEIRRKFDEIVAFAEVEKFLDTPVKRYSSGMYVRLAFAVAAHLEPEILILDEVLAVGDAQFQNKCLGKIQDVARGQGRTVLFVSHNMAAVQRLCSRGIYLERGRMLHRGNVADVIDHYLATGSARDRDMNLRMTRSCSWLRPVKVDLLVASESRRSVKTGEALEIRLAYECTEPSRMPDGITVSFILYAAGQKVANFWSRAGHAAPLPIASSGTVSCIIPNWPFRSLPFTLEVHLAYRGDTLVEVPEALEFDSNDSDLFGTGVVPHHSEGIVLLRHSWRATGA